MLPKPVVIKDYEELTVEQAQQVARLLDEHDDPHRYQYAVQGEKVVLAKTPKKGGNNDT